MPFYRVSNFYVFQTSSGGRSMDPRYRERERLKRRVQFRCEEYVTRNWIRKFVQSVRLSELDDDAISRVRLTSIPYLRRGALHVIHVWKPSPVDLYLTLSCIINASSISDELCVTVAFLNFAKPLLHLFFQFYLYAFWTSFPPIKSSIDQKYRGFFAR